MRFILKAQLILPNLTQTIRRDFVMKMQIQLGPRSFKFTQRIKQNRINEKKLFTKVLCIFKAILVKIELP